MEDKCSNHRFCLGNFQLRYIESIGNNDDRRQTMQIVGVDTSTDLHVSSELPPLGLNGLAIFHKIIIYNLII